MSDIRENKRRFSIILFGLLAISLIIYFAFIRPQQKHYYDHHVNIHGIFFLNPVTVSPFVLMDHQGQEFTLENLKNHWTMLFFGFTRCPNVCPTTLNVLNKMYHLLQESIPNQDLPQVVFITIDPENDTSAKLKDYVSSFNPRFIGASTSKEETKALEKLFFVTATKVKDLETNEYTFNHSPEIILVNPEGKIQAYFSYPPRPEELASDYYAIWSHAGNMKKNI